MNPNECYDLEPGEWREDPPRVAYAADRSGLVERLRAEMLHASAWTSGETGTGPRIAVHGRTIDAPPGDDDIAWLRNHARPAPYGRGEETRLDRAVRDAGQIDAAHVRLAGDAWTRLESRMRRAIRAGMGLGDAAPRLVPLKLLVYAPGGHFAEHVDTEKCEGMIASATLVLPGTYRGGALTVEHAGETLRFAQDGAPAWRFAAWYADCRHRLEPVEAGVRLAVTFGVAIDPERALEARTPDRGVAEAFHRRSYAEHHTRWAARGARVRPGAGQYGLKTVWVLEHRYTEPGLSAPLLKGRATARSHDACSPSRAKRPSTSHGSRSGRSDRPRPPTGTVGKWRDGTTTRGSAPTTTRATRCRLRWNASTSASTGPRTGSSTSRRRSCTRRTSRGTTPGSRDFAPSTAPPGTTGPSRSSTARSSRTGCSTKRGPAARASTRTPATRGRRSSSSTAARCSCGGGETTPPSRCSPGAGDGGRWPAEMAAREACKRYTNKGTARLEPIMELWRTACEADGHGAEPEAHAIVLGALDARVAMGGETCKPFLEEMYIEEVARHDLDIEVVPRLTEWIAERVRAGMPVERWTHALKGVCIWGHPFGGGGPALARALLASPAIEPVALALLSGRIEPPTSPESARRAIEAMQTRIVEQRWIVRCTARGTVGA